jgi:hypothetical protein
MRETELKEEEEEDLRHREKAIKKQEEELRTRENFFWKNAKRSELRRPFIALDR